MELSKIKASKRLDILNAVLDQIVTTEERDEIVTNIKLYFEDGSDLYSIGKDDEVHGFFVSSAYKDDSGNIEELVLDEFFLVKTEENTQLTSGLSTGIKQLNKSIRPEKLEVVLTRDLLWLGEALSASGYIAEMIKLEKILPNPKYLGDVLELIEDSIPRDRVSEDMIIQILLQREEEYTTQIIDSIDELEELIDDKWIPIMVVLSFEPLDQQIAEIIEPSNQLINWDDFEIVYTI